MDNIKLCGGGTTNLTLEDLKNDLISDLNLRTDEKILEPANRDLLSKLIYNAESKDEAIAIAELGTSYKRTGFHFDKKLEKIGTSIKYFKKNEQLSFSQDKTAITHKLIIGDNYDALLNLSISYRGKIDVIYIDPPYGKDDMGDFAKTNYENAITRDNLLSMLYPRLILAKQLLSDEGVIFCSIDDKNHAYVRCLFDEVFSEKNFIADTFVLDNLKGKSNDKLITSIGHKVLVYARQKDALVEAGGFNLIKTSDDKSLESEYPNFDSESNSFYKEIPFKKTGQEKMREDRPNSFFPILYKNGQLSSIQSSEYDKIYSASTRTFNDLYLGSLQEKYENLGYEFILPKDKHSNFLRWTYSFEGTNDLIQKGYLVYKKGKSIYLRKYPSPIEIINNSVLGVPKSLFYRKNYANGTTDLDDIVKNSNFSFPKPVSLIKDLISLHKNSNSIVLDFFAGSGTTGQAVLELNKEDGGNRKFILCTNNEKTDNNPNGIAYDVTSKRLKRVMTGCCYDRNSDFEWIKKNDPLGDNLDVYEIEKVSNIEQEKGKNPLDVIDETLYDEVKMTPKDKINWMCRNFSITQRYLLERKEQ